MTQEQTAIELQRRVFAKGLDIHRATAAEVFDIELDQVSVAQRRSAKAINFGSIATASPAACILKQTKE